MRYFRLRPRPDEALPSSDLPRVVEIWWDRLWHARCGCGDYDEDVPGLIIETAMAREGPLEDRDWEPEWIECPSCGTRVDRAEDYAEAGLVDSGGSGYWYRFEWSSTGGEWIEGPFRSQAAALVKAPVDRDRMAEVHDDDDGGPI